jgi:hypothetical protein
MIRHKGDTGNRAILQYTKENEFIQEFSSLINALKLLKINHGNLAQCLQEKYKTCGGFIWKYKPNEVNNEEILKIVYIDGIKTTYKVSNLGNIYNKSGKKLKGHIGSGNYITLSMSYDKNNVDIKYNPSLHRLVAKVFIPNLKNKKLVNHIDSNTL